MKTRYAVNDDGMLVSRDGRVLGKVTSLTIEEPPQIAANSGEIVGDIGGLLNEEQQTIEETLGLNGSSNVKEPYCPYENVWAHYVSLFGNRYELNPKRRKIIEAALKLRDEQTVM